MLSLSGCGLTHHVSRTLGLSQNPDAALGQGAPVPQVFGYAVADEPQAALAGREVLAEGGNAADAASAIGFALAVTLPSRATLGGGGACIVRIPDAQGNLQPPITLVFPAIAPALPGGDRPAAVPALARGLLALQAGYGTLSVAADLAPAERLASVAELSPALEADLQVTGNALTADPVAASLFAPNGTLLPAGTNFAQPELAGTLATLRVQGVAGLYSGDNARSFAAAAQDAGATLSAADLNAARVRVVPAALDGTTATLPIASGTLQASTGFVAVDKTGGVVSCAVSPNNLFGSGRFAPGTGVLLAASPRGLPAPVLNASVTTDAASGAVRAAAAGRGNVVTCPGDHTTCTASASANGLAVGSNGT